jgi:hypothetical protein
MKVIDILWRKKEMFLNIFVIEVINIMNYSEVRTWTQQLPLVLSIIIGNVVDAV